MWYWSLLAYLLYVITIEIFINIRISRLEHAVRILILTEVKNQDKALDIIAKYAGISVFNSLKHVDKDAPKYIVNALNQIRRATGLRLMLHILGLIGVFVWIVIA